MVKIEFYIEYSIVQSCSTFILAVIAVRQVIRLEDVLNSGQIRSRRLREVRTATMRRTVLAI